VAVTIYGVIAVTFMMVMYALESRSRHFIAAFALGCALSSSYGFLAGTWPFGVVEGVWTFVALRRYYLTRPQAAPALPGERAATVGAAQNSSDEPTNGRGIRRIRWPGQSDR
jgi:hypothetical protein